MPRNIARTLGFAMCLACSMAKAGPGYHNTAVIPIVVDSTSFTQSFTFDTYNGAGVTVEAQFHPGVGTAQAALGPLACNDVTVGTLDGTVIPSLRNLCPTLAAGSAFGFLALRAKPSHDDSFVDLPMFAVSSRVSNPEGAGFVVDVHAAAAYGSAWTRVTGLRRTAATANAPAFQTNCFIGGMNQYGSGGSIAARRVDYKLVKATSGIVPFVPWPIYTGTVNVEPGRLIRLLDVFEAAGAPAGDHEDWMIEFMPKGGGRPGILAFCTVQDNSSFQADVRLAKPFFGAQGLYADESLAARNQYWNEDVLGRAFEIPPGAAANTHVVYFRRPDTVKCELTSATYPNTSLPPERLAAAHGLEIRMLDAGGAVIAGGSGMTSTGQVYLGDKDATLATLDGRYRIEVESNGQNTGATRGYSLYCTSGSGNSGGFDLIRYQEPVDRF